MAPVILLAVVKRERERKRHRDASISLVSNSKQTNNDSKEEEKKVRFKNQTKVKKVEKKLPPMKFPSFRKSTQKIHTHSTSRRREGQQGPRTILLLAYNDSGSITSFTHIYFFLSDPSEGRWILFLSLLR